ncbi:hypothetical protein GON26_06085 [Flavobacterium sp. GA093]|uniref:Uncharacterized protein n=1 Tax=Flavobacterium hydrocarbonoxydans TaxID=2683249 RepID=A0A6I4NIZ5_9FLAO|nr:hypothetical protein [Flavobacterium hydrocarbonoxydans]MWB93923.1 hypothetical protein [Flavobacterium hydrocarbonoxydans]
MNTTEQANRNSIGNRDPRNTSQDKTDKNTLMNEELYDIDKIKMSDNDNKEIAERGYTIRNGYDPNRPNPEQDQVTNDEDDLDDLDDDFHTDRDLEDDDLIEEDLEDDDLVEEDLDLDGDELNTVNDEFDNPSDVTNGDFNETEEDLEDIDQDDEEEEDFEEIIEIEEDEQEEDYPANDPRKF